MIRALLMLGFVAGTLVTPAALAHTRSQSFSHWNIDERSIEFEFAVDARRVTQLTLLYELTDELPALLMRHVQETVQVNLGSTSCTLTNLRALGKSRAVIRLAGRFTCPGSASMHNAQATVTSFQTVSPTHIHIARIEHDAHVAEVVIREGRSTISLGVRQSATDFSGFITSGFLHVLSGLDHLAFLLALVLVATTARTAILCITGFTLGHSLALAVATLGWITPDERLIEAMIGFTIAITALEAGVHYGLKRRSALLGFALLTLVVALPPLAQGPGVIAMGIALTAYAASTGHFTDSQAKTLLPVMTTVFGLVHGAGFAGGLKEAMIYQTELLVPLFGFNIGVELAQLCALAVFYSAPWMITRLIVVNAAFARHAAGIVVFALGCFWYAQRLWT